MYPETAKAISTVLQLINTAMTGAYPWHCCFIFVFALSTFYLLTYTYLRKSDMKAVAEVNT